MEIKKYNEYLKEDNSQSYLLGNPTYKWVKRLMTKEIHFIQPKDTTRSEVLSNRKNDLRLDEFQSLYDYYNFCDKMDFDLLYNTISHYKRIINDWVWYLVTCQLFPNEMKNAISGNSRNLYDNRYEEIISLPNLTGDIEEDKKILSYVIKEHFFKSESPVRNGFMLYDIYMKNRVF